MFTTNFILCAAGIIICRVIVLTIVYFDTTSPSIRITRGKSLAQPKKNGDHEKTRNGIVCHY